MSDKIPSDEEVRNAYAHTYAKTRTAGMQHQQVWLDEQQRINGLAEFDRWLTEHDRQKQAEAWDEGHAEGETYGAQVAEFGIGYAMPVENPYREVSK